MDINEFVGLCRICDEGFNNYMNASRKNNKELSHKITVLWIDYLDKMIEQGQGKEALKLLKQEIKSFRRVK